MKVYIITLFQLLNIKYFLILFYILILNMVLIFISAFCGSKIMLLFLLIYVIMFILSIKMVLLFLNLNLKLFGKNIFVLKYILESMPIIIICDLIILLTYGINNGIFNYLIILNICYIILYILYFNYIRIRKCTDLGKIENNCKNCNIKCSYKLYKI